jgi:uncharacterized membrane protein
MASAADGPEPSEDEKASGNTNDNEVLNPDMRRPGRGSTRRMEALSDAVFAIVMTLIVLEVHVPTGPPSKLPEQFLEATPTLLTYALTFITVGVLWFGNRTQSELLIAADHPLVWLNLLFLGLVALIPFSSALLARNPTTSFAVVEYGAHLTAASLAHALCWVYASHRPELIRVGISHRYLRFSRAATFLLAAFYAVGAAIGAAFPIVGLIVFLAAPIPFISGLYYRQLARHR